MSTQNGYLLSTFLIETESQNTLVNSLKKNMAVMASDGPSPHFPSLCLGLTNPQPSRCHHARSLLGPSFHGPRTLHVLESRPERAAPAATMSNDMLSALTPPLHCKKDLSQGAGETRRE